MIASSIANPPIGRVGWGHGDSLARTARDPRQCAALKRMGWLTALTLALPALPTTSLRNTYAFALAAYAILAAWRTGVLATGLSRIRRWAIVCGLSSGAVYTVSLLAFSLQPTPKDYFVVFRETYPYLMFFATAGLWDCIVPREREHLLLKIAWVYLGVTVIGFLLQEFVPFVADLMLYAYHIQATEGEGVRGFMMTRPGLTFGNPNNLGYASTLVGLVGVAIRQPGKWRTPLSTVVASLCIFWTFSRTALLVWCVVLTIVALYFRPKLLLYAGLALSAFLIAYTFCGLSESGFVQRWEERLFVDHSALEERQDLWESLLGSSMWRQNWLFGVGPDTESVEVFDSAYITYLYRYGLVGLIAALLWPVGCLFYGCLLHRSGSHESASFITLAITIASLVASYAMVPNGEPRLAALTAILLGSISMGPEEIAAGRRLSARRAYEPPRLPATRARGAARRRTLHDSEDNLLL